MEMLAGADAPLVIDVSSINSRSVSWCDVSSAATEMSVQRDVAQPLHQLMVRTPGQRSQRGLGVYTGAHTYTHAHCSYSSVWNGNSPQSSAFGGEICQEHPAEVLIMAGQQSVNHY